MSGKYSQQRDTGVRHSNPKPHPHKKARRVAGTGRRQGVGMNDMWWNETAWRHRRSIKESNGFSDQYMAQAYEKMTPKAYRHNLAVSKNTEVFGVYSRAKQYVNMEKIVRDNLRSRKPRDIQMGNLRPEPAKRLKKRLPGRAIPATKVLQEAAVQVSAWAEDSEFCFCGSDLVCSGWDTKVDKEIERPPTSALPTVCSPVEDSRNMWQLYLHLLEFQGLPLYGEEPDWVDVVSESETNLGILARGEEYVLL